ncbi:phage baseplate assembly protein V [Opitutaceae bacterium TAV4]|nr:phage baseplate assembly protein V [Opitutaceae bacterium TAV4]RRK00792.1 phage baseplate assembly protein V [Opitutaceae bacterium TAV3]
MSRILTDAIRRITELERRQANMLRIGTVEQLTAKPPRVRVRIGPLLTTWLRWLTYRAGNVRTWSAPTVGEQILVLAPTGDLAQAVVLPALNQDDYPAPGDNPAETVAVFPGGLRVRTLADGSAVIDATALTLKAGQVTIDAPVATTSTITSAGDHVADGISLKQHTHGGVDRGSSQTDPPS